MPSRLVSRHAMNGNASLPRSTSLNTAPTTSRDFGPTTGKVCHCSVTDVNRTRRCGHSVCSHSSIQSRILAAPPVVVNAMNRSSANRMTVPSSMTMPSTPHITP